MRVCIDTEMPPQVLRRLFHGATPWHVTQVAKGPGYRECMAGTVRAAGDEVGGYRVVRTLGAGGSGHVYLVEQPDGALAALKLVDSRAQPAAGERLRREVRALQSLRHDAVPRVLDAELDDEETFVVFEFIPGVSLAQHVAEHGPLHGDELAECAERLASALYAAHTAGVIHRDVTPANVMLSPRGAVLIDFGLSHREDDARLTRDGLVSGTAGYVAPEVIDGAEPGPDADRWSWAATIAFAMTGEAPFGVGGGAIRRTLAGDLTLADHVTGADHVRAALSREPALRPSPAEVVGGLRGATEVLPPLERTRVMPVEQVREAAFTEVLDQRPGTGWDYSEGYVGQEDQPEDADAVGEGEALAWEEMLAEPKPHRPVLLLSWTVTVSFAAALAPVLAFGSLVLGALVGRATYRRAEALRVARLRHGERRRDAVLHTMGLPWHMARALVELLPSVAVAGVLGAGVAAGGWWLVSSHTVATPDPAHQAWGHAASLALGALAAAASLWWGLWSGGTREGAHRFAASVAPTPGVSALWVVVAVVATAGIAVAAWLLVPPWWWPLPPMPR